MVQNVFSKKTPGIATRREIIESLKDSHRDSLPSSVISGIDVAANALDSCPGGLQR